MPALFGSKPAGRQDARSASATATLRSQADPKGPALSARTEQPSSSDPAPKLPRDLIFQIIAAIGAIATTVYVMVELL